jgi:hypothetical protein
MEMNLSLKTREEKGWGGEGGRRKKKNEIG